MTDEEVILSRYDLEMIKRDYLWPHISFLPLKRYTNLGAMELGVILNNNKQTVILINMIEIMTDHKKTIENIKTIHYKSIEDLIQDGWKVD